MFEPFIFVFGTLGFWILSVIAALAIVIALDKENGWGAVATLVGFTVAVTLWGSGVSIFSWAVANPWLIVAGIAGYLVIGTVWGVAKWALKVRKEAFKAREEYLELKHTFFQNNEIDVVNYKKTPVPEKLQAQWLAHLRGDTQVGFARGVPKYINFFKNGKFTPPKIHDYKSTLMLWMAFWPLSALWTLIDDFVKELYEHIYRLLADWLQSLSDKAFAKLIALQESDTDLANPTDLLDCPKCARTLKQDCGTCKGKKKVTLKQYKAI